MNGRTNNPRDDRTGNGETVMDCAQFEDIVHDLGRRGGAADALRQAALAHATSCRNCAQLLRQTESLDDALRALAADAAHLAMPPRVEAALAEEFRRQRAASARRRSWQRIAAMGIAASLLLAVGLSVHSWYAKREVAVQTPTRSAPPAPSETAAPSEAAVVADANDFVLLPYGADSAAAGEGTVVRVLLSRASLSSLGVSVAGLGGKESVLADLVVSEDGTPEAIRFVAEQSTTQEF